MREIQRLRLRELRYTEIKDKVIKIEKAERYRDTEIKIERDIDIKIKRDKKIEIEKDAENKVERDTEIKIERAEIYRD